MQTIPEVLPGDRINLDVPILRMLPKGHYRLKVERVEQKGKDLVLYLSYKPNPKHKSTAFLQFTAPQTPRFTGWGFLGKDQHPVQYQIERSLSQRLISSLETVRNR